MSTLTQVVDKTDEIVVALKERNKATSELIIALENYSKWLREQIK